jgi:eukaryotic-like serine/threonine-protein kinase
MEATSRIGPYEIVREIGRGGMGIVYLAREPLEGELLALKVLPETWSNDASRLERFQREAATVMKVRHPNIIPIYAVGRADGVRFIAMKYIEGKPLDQLIREQSVPDSAGEHDVDEPRPHGDFVDQLGPPISWCRGGAVATAGPPIGSVRHRPAAKPAAGPAEPVSRAAEPGWVYRSVVIVETIARALDHLHSRGITHRDVKPANIIVDGRGEPWLADFGLVRDLDTRVASEAEGLVGTVQYIAPEQILCSQSERDSRSDLYSLGVTLYELVTLRRPFDGGDPVSILHVAASEPPVPPRGLNPKLTGAFENVIQKAMAKDPDARFQTGNEFAEELRRLRSFAPKAHAVAGAAAPAPAGRKDRRLLLALIFLLLLAVGLAEWCLHGALVERGRLRDCRTEADRAFEAGEWREAAAGYRVCLKLGVTDATILQRLRFCEDEARWRAPK